VNLSVTQAFPQVDDLRYSYDPAGNLTRVVNVQGAPANGAPTRTECFTYDTLDRLSTAWTATDSCAAAPSAATVGGPTPYWTSWTFDQLGLRKTQVQHTPSGPSGDTTTSYTYPTSGAGTIRPHALSSTSTTGPAGSSSTSYVYNPAGDTTTRTLPAGNQTLAWTEDNRLSSVTTPTGTVSYVYDADGTQLIRRDPGSTTLFLPGEEIVRDTATGTLTGTRYYSHNGTVVALRVGGGNISYLQADQHATTQVSVKAEASDDHTVSRRSFDPYGNPLGAGIGVWPDHHGFLDKPHNPVTGLTDVGARTYDPATARFQSVDPILDTANPGSWPGYTYSNNNPTTFSDPSGLHTVCGLGFGDCGYDGEAWGSHPDKAADMDTQARVKRARHKLTSPIKAHGKKVDSETIRGFRETFGYTGSDDFTYADGLAFATQGNAQWDIFCQATGHTSNECRFNPFTGNPDIHDGGATAIHALLDIVGFVPLLGEPADGFNALLYLGEGNVTDAAISGISLIPDIGDSAKFGRLSREVNDALKTLCSFSGDTEVLMADDTHKRIKDIQVGDKVFATDPDTGQQGPRSVTAVLVHQDTVIDLALDDSSTVTTTHNHPFYSNTDNAWEPADQLHLGDQLGTATGHKVRFSGLRPGTAHIATAYNLTVQDIHTYHVMVGREPVLVHNTCPAPNATVRDLLAFAPGNPMEAGKNLSRLSDKNLIDSVFTPFNGVYEYMKVAKSGTLLDGTHRASELLRRAAEPGGSITMDTPIYIQGFGG
jgi:RHS repeat-associated protein